MVVILTELQFWLFWCQACCWAVTINLCKVLGLIITISNRFVKPILEEKDDSWRDATAELALQV